VFVGYLSAVRESQASGDWSESEELLSMLMRYQEVAHPELRSAMELELRYNRLNIFKRVQVSYLLLGGLMLLCAFLGLFGIGGRYIKWLTRALGILVLIIFHFQMIGMGMRWRIGGHAPWSNSYETMVYVSWASVCCGLLFARRSALTLSLSVLFGGVILFVSSLSWLDPEISPLVPVLKSPWLMFHVAVIMMSYGFFGLGFLLGIVNLLLSIGGRDRKFVMSVTADLWRINEISLLLGLMLMTIGTFMGAIWANESWGR
jgi:ABC-type transport system involved in cytochrome c biogenesis permease subunit